MIFKQKWITREDCKANPHCVYVFGDNVVRKGFGGQAKEMRGEPNAVGIVTKWSPRTWDSAYFDDKDYDDITSRIIEDLDKVRGKLLFRKTKALVLPLDGLGTGLSRMPEKCPKIYEFLTDKLNKLEDLLNA